MSEERIVTFKDEVDAETFKKNSKPSRTWCFTLNNYTTGDMQMFRDLSCNYIIFGEEIGESGTPHLQGYIIFAKTHRFSSVKRVAPKAHWEIAKADEQAANYCMKEQNYFIKDNRRPGVRTDLEVAAKVCVEEGLYTVAKSHPSLYIKYHNGFDKLYQTINPQSPRDFKPSVVWLYGETGVGKTHVVYQLHKNDIWFSGDNLLYWDGYRNQDAIVLDDFRAKFCTLSILLRILDRYPYRCNIKNSSQEFNSRFIYITSPVHPKYAYRTTDEDINQLVRRCDFIFEMTKDVIKEDEYGDQIPFQTSNYNEVLEKLLKNRQDTLDRLLITE